MKIEGKCEHCRKADAVVGFSAKAALRGRTRRQFTTGKKLKLCQDCFSKALGQFVNLAKDLR